MKEGRGGMVVVGEERREDVIRRREVLRSLVMEVSWGKSDFLFLVSFCVRLFHTFVYGKGSVKACLHTKLNVFFFLHHRDFYDFIREQRSLGIFYFIFSCALELLSLL